jgi:hypothetical protein
MMRKEKLNDTYCKPCWSTIYNYDNNPIENPRELPCRLEVGTGPASIWGSDLHPAATRKKMGTREMTMAVVTHNTNCVTIIWLKHDKIGHRCSQNSN